MDDFEQFEKRLNILDENIRCLALEYASEFYVGKKMTREEALEKGISRAELERRNL